MGQSSAPNLDKRLYFPSLFQNLWLQHCTVVQEHTTNWKKVCMTSAESYCYMRIYQRKLPISYQEAQTLLRQPYMFIQNFQGSHIRMITIDLQLQIINFWWKMEPQTPTLISGLVRTLWLSEMTPQAKQMLTFGCKSVLKRTVLAN